MFGLCKFTTHLQIGYPCPSDASGAGNEKSLILGVDFLEKFGFRLVEPGQERSNDSNIINSINFYRLENYFSDQEEVICFQISP